MKKVSLKELIMSETLKKQLKQLSMYLPKHIVLKHEGKDRDFTEDEMVVIKDYIMFYYGLNGWKPARGMIVKHFSKKSYIDFAFMDKADENGEFCIYLNVK